MWHVVIWSDRCTIIVSINYNIISLQNSNERLFYNIQLNSDNRNNSGIIHIQLFTLNIDYEVTSNGGPTQYPYHMTGVTRRTGTVYTSASPEFNPGVLWGSCCSIFSFLFSVFYFHASYTWPYSNTSLRGRHKPCTIGNQRSYNELIIGSICFWSIYCFWLTFVK
jgi:hypothetical protein